MQASKKKRASIVIAILLVLLVLIAALAVAFRPTTVPDVTKMPLAEATALIEQFGLAVGASSQVATSALGEGRVLSQRPGAGSVAPSRSSVDLTTSVAPAITPVPDVVGARADDAARTLAEALYLPVTVDIFSADLPVGDVVKQVPSAGFEWLTGRPVAYAVGVGPDDGTGVAVPDVKGKSIEGALAEVAATGLAAQGLVRDIASPEDNVVVDQLPDSGTVVRSGTTVLLLFTAP